MSLFPKQIFELLGAFLLTQFGYDGFDLETHRQANAIVVSHHHLPVLLYDR